MNFSLSDMRLSCRDATNRAPNEEKFLETPGFVGRDPTS